MNTTQQGTLGETKVMYELAKLGLPIFREISNTSKTDVITIIDGKCIKIQCKLVNSINNESISVMLESTTSGEMYTEKDFDVLAAYIPQVNKIVYLSWKDIGDNKTLTLRFKLNENRQKNSKLIRLVDNYTDFNHAFGVVA